MVPISQLVLTPTRKVVVVMAGLSLALGETPSLESAEGYCCRSRARRGYPRCASGPIVFSKEASVAGKATLLDVEAVQPLDVARSGLKWLTQSAAFNR